MAADAMAVADGGLIRYVDGSLDADTDTIKLALFNSSFVTTVLTYSTTNELATQFGYTQGGETLTYGGVTRLSETSSVVTFDADDEVWTAAGGSIVHRYGVMYTDDASDYIWGYILADNAPADVTVTDGNTLTYQWNASGVWTLS